MNQATIRPMTPDEIRLIQPCLEGLADHHNRTAADFSGIYPTMPIETHLHHMKEHVENNTALILGLFLEDGALGGFGMASAEAGLGEIDYLYVRDDLRGSSWGGQILEKLLDYLDRTGARFIDVKGVDGNPARNFYEKHGFSLRSVVLSRKNKTETDKG